jgi:hypothetical protein
MCERWDPSRGLSIDWSRHKIDLKITWKVQGPKGKTSFSYPQGEWRLSEHGRQTETLVAIKSPGLWSPRCSGEGRNRERERGGNMEHREVLTTVGSEGRRWISRKGDRWWSSGSDRLGFLRGDGFGGLQVSGWCSADSTCCCEAADADGFARRPAFSGQLDLQGVVALWFHSAASL